MTPLLVCLLGTAAANGATLLSENFDSVSAGSLPAGWTTATTGPGTPFSTTATGADSSPNVAFVNGVTTVATSALLSPVFSSTTSQIVLSFMQAWNFESVTSSFDGGVLEISINGGSFVDINTFGLFTTGGYTGVISTSFSNPLGGRQAWVRNQPTYVNTTGTFSVNPGDNLQLRWRAGFDSSTTAGNPNWRIDTISITDAEASSVPEPTSAVLAALGTLGLLGFRFRRSR